MGRDKKYFIVSLLLTFIIGLFVLLIGLFLYTSGEGLFPTTIKETVIVIVTPTSTPIPSPTATSFPASKNRIVFLSVWESDFYIINADGTDLARITNDGSHKSCPTWLPNGKRISFLEPSATDGFYDLYVMDVDGKNKQLLINARFDTEYGQLPKWSPDGSKLIFSAYEANSNNSQIYIFDGINIQKITEGNTKERFPVWSPDGQKFAFISYPEGKPILVVKRFSIQVAMKHG